MWSLKQAIYLLCVTASVRPKLLDIEEEVSLDTKICEDAAKLSHDGDLNASLDLFVTCLLKKLEKLPDNDDGEIAEVMSTLETVEHLNVDGHNIVKRESDGYSDEDPYSLGDTMENEDIDSQEILEEEGRKWKNKRKKDKKQKKKNRRKFKEAVLEIQEEEVPNVTLAEVSSKEMEENASEQNQGQSQVLQFSAYSGTTSQPKYQAEQMESMANSKHDKEFEDEKEDGGRRKYLYSVDYQVGLMLSCSALPESLLNLNPISGKLSLHR